ncbi:DUF2878 domain-containing protein [Reinekea sp. G2M2-21]|uniref:DUF2878 domain-containing protein n=1 Tax=Reinekea sp. G2M2-21 TaxID=2788942 RepID=UPI0018ABBFAD|nr:DUF2878 domain-containing protein [Reinekea sp. G2M2-21]
MDKIANYALFQIGWFLAVLFQSPWSLLWALMFVGVHAFAFNHRKETWQLLPVMLIGLSIDLIWHLSPFIEYLGLGFVVPTWIIALWMIFPLTLNHSLAWLKGRLTLQVLFGILGGGGSYVAGTKLGAANATPLGLLLVASAWGLWLPFFYWIIDRPRRKLLINRSVGAR